MTLDFVTATYTVGKPAGLHKMYSITFTVLASSSLTRSSGEGCRVAVSSAKEGASSTTKFLQTMNPGVQVPKLQNMKIRSHKPCSSVKKATILISGECSTVLAGFGVGEDLHHSQSPKHLPRLCQALACKNGARFSVEGR